MVLALHVQGEKMTEDHNLVVEDPRAVFVGADELDFRSRRGSVAIDSGAEELAPEVDIEGVKRPRGDGVDVGAFEFVGK